MPRKKKDSTPITSPVTPHGGKPVPNQSLQETENTYAIICATIIKAVSSSKHYLHFLPDKRNIDNAIKLGALHMRDDYSNTSDLEKLGISEGILLPQDFNRDDFLDALLNHQTIHSSLPGPPGWLRAGGGPRFFWCLVGSRGVYFYAFGTTPPLGKCSQG